jgi:glycosyltransferase involved in cell wall biosynthesis
MGCIHFLKETFGVILPNKDIGQVIVVDNTHSNETLSYLSSLNNDKLVVIRNKVNQGVIKSRNQGLALSTGEYTMILDDDQVPKQDDHTFNQYKALLDKYDILGCEAQIMDLRTGLTQFGTKDNFTYVGAGGMCMKTALWKELGLFDEIFQPAYFEDPDICLKAKKAGYTIGLVLNHGIHHYAHRTLFRNDLGFNHDDVMLRNRKIFMARYGVKPKPKKIVPVKSPPIVYGKRGQIKVMHILSNINIGGVQQNAAYLAKGLSGEAFNMAMYIAESGKRGVFERHLNDSVKVFYNKKVAPRNRIKVYKNTSHGPQSIIDKKGKAIIVKPGGTLPDLGYNLNQIRGFRLDGEIPAEVDVSIVDAVVSYVPDIIHYHRDVSRISRDITRLKAMPQFKKLKVVRTVHGSHLPDLRNYDKAVLLTNEIMKGAGKRYPQIPSIYIPNGIDTNVFKPIKCPKENIVVTHTRLSKILKLTARPELYFDIVSRVCKSDTTVKFVLVGPDYDLYKARFDGYIRRFNLKDKLIIRPPMYHKELVAYINKAKVWFYPTSEDAFPLSVIEAMACKLPIVASNLVGISEMITSNESGLLSDPSDVSTFVKNILKLLSDRVLAEAMGATAYKKALEAYSLETMLNKYSEVYLDLMGVK